MIKLGLDSQKQLLKLYEESQVYLEGNILKVLDSEGNIEFEKYISNAIEKDKANRRKRLEVTKQVQSQNKELESAQKENIRVNNQLSKSLDETNKALETARKSKIEAEQAKHEAELSLVESEEAEAKAKEAWEEAEKAKQNALQDLDILQKKSQTELISTIVKVALYVILGVGLVTSTMYLTVLFTGHDSQIIGSTWSNMFGILLTNAFSIVGTIMGVKYASENNKNN